MACFYSAMSEEMKVDPPEELETPMEVDEPEEEIKMETQTLQMARSVVQINLATIKTKLHISRNIL